MKYFRSAILALLFFSSSASAQVSTLPAISKVQALHILHDTLPQVRILSSELERERGLRVWSFDVGDGKQLKEVWINAETGKIESIQMESKHDQALEKRIDRVEAFVKRRYKDCEVVASSVNGAGKAMRFYFQIKKADGTMRTITVSDHPLKIVNDASAFVRPVRSKWRFLFLGAL